MVSFQEFGQASNVASGGNKGLIALIIVFVVMGLFALYYKYKHKRVALART